MHIRKEMLSILAVCMLSAGFVQGAPEVDDSVIAALDAEIAQADGGSTGGKGDGAKADELIKSIEEEIAGLGTGGEGGSEVGKRPSGPPNGRNGNALSKGVIISGRGSAKTKARAEEIACWNAVWSALCKYAGTDLVKKNSDAVKKRTMSVAKNVIERHEIVEESESDEKYTVKVKAWIGKKSLASEFSDIFPDALGGGEVNRPAPDWGDEEPPVSKDQSVVVVTATGKGETKEEAKKAAFRAAVEKAIGAWVDAESRMEKSELLKDSVNSISNGDIKRCETLDERRESSGLYACKIKAWVEKKAIAPKFKKVFPAAFKDIGEAAVTLHAERITRQDREKDAAALMTAELKDVNRMWNWVRLSVTKGRGLEGVNKIKLSGRDMDVREVPGKGLYSVRYSMTIDDAAYFKGFLPHFKEMLTKMQEGEAEENVVLTSSPFEGCKAPRGCVENDGNDRVILATDNGNYDLPPDVKPYVNGLGKIGRTYFVDPIVLSGFPGVASGESLGWSDTLSNGSFMFDQYDAAGVKIKAKCSCNIWLLDRMNKDRTSVRCSAYKVPTSALMAYWKNLYGSNIDISGCMTFRTHEKIEVVLLDGDGEEIAARIDDHVPVTLLANGPVSGSGRCPWRSLNVFNSFFVRPMFVNYSLYPAPMGRDNGTTCYSTEIQREVYFPLTDSQLGRVKKVKVRFVGAGKVK